MSNFLRVRAPSRVRLRCKGFTLQVIKVLEQTFDPSMHLTGAEIGVAQGNTSIVLLHWFTKLRLFMIDKYKKGELRQDLDKLLLQAKLGTDFARDRRIIIIGHSLEAAPLIPDESLDFVFVDANHYYEYVVRDLVAWFPKVKPRGILIGHDYNAPKHEQQMGVWGVKQAVDEFVEQKQLELHVEPYLVWWVRK